MQSSNSKYLGSNTGSGKFCSHSIMRSWQPAHGILWLLLLQLVGGDDRAKCIAAINSHGAHFRDLSAVFLQDHNWDLLHRRGEARVCLKEGHRFFFVLLFYQIPHIRPATSDFGVCLPRDCDPILISEEVIPKMYHEFFDYHLFFHPDGKVDEVNSMHYSITVKEYKTLDNLSADLDWSVYLGAAIVILPCLLVALWELFHFVQKAIRGEVKQKSLRPSIIVNAFSVRIACEELVSVPEGEEFARDLCWVRVAYVTALIVLHVTQGSKWRHIEVLEVTSSIFAAVRPLALVQDAFVQLSAYLCACSDSKALRNGDSHVSVFSRLWQGLVRSWRKYLRQLPVCLFWNWFYLVVLPRIPYNPYNHAFPWFGIRWYHATARCMKRKWRYSFLLGDVGALLLGDGDNDWYAGNGNPCVNMWNFQFEIQAFTLATCLLALGRSTALSICIAIVAFGFGTVTHVDAWWAHHARGIALQMLVICSLGLASRPLGTQWRHLRWLGSFFLLLAGVIHGISRGGWADEYYKHEVQEYRLLATGLWQAALALGTALLCEGCRTLGGGPARPWLAALNRLAFGINVAHPFVQFFVESFTTLNDRVFSLFSWPTHLALIFVLTALPAMLVYILVQRPWAMILQYLSDVSMVRLGWVKIPKVR